MYKPPTTTGILRFAVWVHIKNKYLGPLIHYIYASRLKFKVHFTKKCHPRILVGQD